MIPSVLAQHVEQGVNSRVQGAGFRGPQTCPLPPFTSLLPQDKRTKGKQHDQSTTKNKHPL